MVRHNFIKLTQNMFLINTQNLIYHYAKCNCKLWNAPLLRFLGISIHYSYFIFQSTVFSQNFHKLCVLLMYTFLYVNMPNGTAGYGRFSDSIAFLGIFIYYYMFETLQLHQFFTNCVLRQKCNHLW